MDAYFRLNVAVIIGFFGVEFFLMDRLSITSSIFRIDGMDTGFLSENIRRHEGVSYRILLAVSGLIVMNFVLSRSDTDFSALLVGLLCIFGYAALVGASYYNQFNKLRRNIQNLTDKK